MPPHGQQQNPFGSLLGGRRNRRQGPAPTPGLQPGLQSGGPVTPPSFGGRAFQFPGVPPLGGSGVGSSNVSRNDIAQGLMRTVIPFLAEGAPTALGTGLGTLNDIIGSQGATDPALLNRNLADISRTSQNQQDALQGQLAAMGLSGSLAGIGAGQAVAGAGADRRAQAIAEETRLAEERKRSDLVNLLLPFFVNPALQSQANLFGLSGVPSEPSDFESGLAGVTGLIDAIAPF